MQRYSLSLFAKRNGLYYKFYRICKHFSAIAQMGGKLIRTIGQARANLAITMMAGLVGFSRCPIVIAHHRIARHINGEDGSQLHDGRLDPAAPVLVILARMGIHTAQEDAAHAPGHHVVPRRISERDECGAGHGHDRSLVQGWVGVTSKWVSFKQVGVL